LANWVGVSIGRVARNDRIRVVATATNTACYKSQCLGALRIFVVRLPALFSSVGAAGQRLRILAQPLPLHIK
jgi:hypothetical protein